ncbi:MAG: UDP-N-acetylmuramoyl-L-alanine--D-glutamate ligase [Caldimicrobium sp.]
MDLRGKRVVVIGFGKSGQAATRLLLVKGAEVIVSEERPREKLPPSYLSSMEVQGVIFETGGHNPETLKKADLIVVSPGVPPEVFKPAIEKGVPVISELELAFRFLSPEERANIVAITGTNGKTTTTAMISDLLKLSGFKVFTGGNYGIPLSEYVLSNVKLDKIVLEVSSFQLEKIETFYPHIGLLLNITPDHLDRYQSLEEYAYYKYRLFENQCAEDFSLLPYGEPFFKRFKNMIKGKIFWVSEGEKENVSAFVEENKVVLRWSSGEKEIYSLNGFRLFGEHNKFNLAMALLAGRLAGGTPQAGEKLIKEFTGFPHRLEYVGTFGGITFINDSKATNVDATLQALKGLFGPIILILGGRHKGASYKPLAPLIKEKVKVLILMGEARFVIQEELGNLVETYLSEGLPEALAISFQVAKPGDIVLLSPACSSFDQFRDYQERGEVFKDLVKKYAPMYFKEDSFQEVYH